MFNDEQNPNQFVITYELLALIVWIIEHEDRLLEKLVKKAFASGLKDAIKKNEQIDDTQLLEEAQQAIIDFFGILESHMLDALHQQSIKRALEKNLFPSIDKIDTSTCDDIMVRTSIEKAINIPNASQETAKETLYKELLKQWKPNNTCNMN